MRADSMRSSPSPVAVVSAPRTAHASAADDETPEPTSTSQDTDMVPPTTRCPASRTDHTSPATWAAQPDTSPGRVESDRDLAALAIAAHGERRALVGIERHGRAFGQCDRQCEAQVVVG